MNFLGEEISFGLCTINLAYHLLKIVETVSLETKRATDKIWASNVQVSSMAG